MRALFDVNVFAVLNTLRASLPTLRAQRSGHVLDIGSVGGFATAPAVGLYGASKFALEGISEALHGEPAGPLGVRVTIVEPGGLRTDFLNGSSIRVEPAAIEDYAAGAGPVRAAPAHNDGRQPGDPGTARPGHRRQGDLSPGEERTRADRGPPLAARQLLTHPPRISPTRSSTTSGRGRRPAEARCRPGSVSRRRRGRSAHHQQTGYLGAARRTRGAA
ncbi:SDR family NAD(P)-dependent oxidoreductase [Streptomyces zaomyceticus]|uniref:SDR family NAD(P)-dependent oxidoreductase n=1 Tax=Streptomyces zaomyceticus TaxID=68286 RepID=UPI0035D6B82A